MNGLKLPEEPTLRQLQDYVRKVVKERGWDKNTDLELFLLFSEEVGELAKAIRDTRGLYQDTGKDNRVNLEEEFADVLAYLIDLANYFDIDLTKAFFDKEEKNAKRQWL